MPHSNIFLWYRSCLVGNVIKTFQLVAARWPLQSPLVQCFFRAKHSIFLFTFSQQNLSQGVFNFLLDNYCFNALRPVSLTYRDRTGNVSPCPCQERQIRHHTTFVVVLYIRFSWCMFSSGHIYNSRLMETGVHQVYSLSFNQE